MKNYIVKGNLIKGERPCKPGNSVHLTHKAGCFKVHEVTARYFTIMIKGKMFWETGVKESEQVPWENLYCLKGQSPIKIQQQVEEFKDYIRQNCIIPDDGLPF